MDIARPCKRPIGAVGGKSIAGVRVVLNAQAKGETRSLKAEVQTSSASEKANCKTLTHVPDSTMPEDAGVLALLESWPQWPDLAAQDATRA